MGNQCHFVTQTGHILGGFWPGWKWTVVPFYSSFNSGWALAVIKCLGSDRIMIWSIPRLCSCDSSSTFRFQIGFQSNIDWVAAKKRQIDGIIGGFSTATQWITVWLQIWNLEVKEGPKLHNLPIDHVMIQSELRYLIAANILRLKCLVFGDITSPIATVWVFVQ